VLQVLSGSSSEEEDVWDQPDEEEDVARRSGEVRVFGKKEARAYNHS
jgi:uncharacterized cupin superfamily protein